MGKILCYIYNDMADFELTFACQLLKYGSKEIVPISYDAGTVVSNPGLIYKAAASVKEALAFEDVEGIIIPGGWNDEQRPELTELIQKLYRQGKLTAAICAGPQYLARAGILSGHKYTTTLNAEHFSGKGAEDVFPRENYVESGIVRDGNVITAKDSGFVDFAVEIFDWFGLFEDIKEKEDTLKYYKNL